MAMAAERLQTLLPASKRDAFFELVAYPVRGSALANERFFCAEAFARPPTNSPAAVVAGKRAIFAHEQLKELTRDFNERTAGGKWNRILRLEPADQQWRSMRPESFIPPQFGAATEELISPTNFQRLFIATTRPKRFQKAGEFMEINGAISIEAEEFSGKTDRGGKHWEIIPGLGRTGDSVAVYPTAVSGADLTKLASDAARLDYAITFASAGEFSVTAFLIPTHPLNGGDLRFAMALDDGPPILVALNIKDGSAEWAQGVLNATLKATTKLKVPTAGRHTLRVYGVDSGVVLDKLVIDCGESNPGYLGPAGD
jgi:hypothetical protein